MPVAAGAFLLRPGMAFVTTGFAMADYTAVWLVYGRPTDYNFLSMFSLAALALLTYLVAAHWRHATEVQEEYRAELERDVAEREQVQEALIASEQELRELAEQRHEALIQLVDAMVAAVELHDPGSSGHQRRVAQLCAAIGEELGMSAAESRMLWTAAVLHDVGMAAVPGPIVTKPGALSDAEFKVVKQHPELARPVLQRLAHGGSLADIVSEHHERLDGSGYPRGLRAQAIRREAASSLWRTRPRRRCRAGRIVPRPAAMPRLRRCGPAPARFTTPRGGGVHARVRAGVHVRGVSFAARVRPTARRAESDSCAPCCGCRTAPWNTSEPSGCASGRRTPSGTAGRGRP